MNAIWMRITAALKRPPVASYNSECMKAGKADGDGVTFDTPVNSPAWPTINKPTVTTNCQYSPRQKHMKEARWHSRKRMWVTRGAKKLAEGYRKGYTPMSPNKPRMLPKTSTMRILTKRFGSAASASAAVAPVMPTETPQRRLHTPTVSPPQKMA